MTYGAYAVRDTISGAIYPQPNKLIAEKVAEMHGQSEVIPWTLPTDDEREAVFKYLRENYTETRSLNESVEAFFADGFRRRGPVTDPEVDAAARALYGMRVLGGSGYDALFWERRARAALEAARVAE